MIENVIYAEEAEDDVVSSYRWYEACEPGLGEDFLRSVEACTQRIQRNPRLYPIVFDEFRRALVRRFPFEVFYELIEDVIVIYSVFHSSQNPDKWLSRLGHSEGEPAVDDAKKRSALLQDNGNQRSDDA